MARELFRNDYMTASLDDARLALSWQREEPSDDHSVETARKVTAALDALVLEAKESDAKSGNAKTTKVAVLVDLMVVKRTFPRAIALYTAWLLKNRGHIRGGAFATKSLLLRAAISTAILVPGLTMKGFSDLDDAHAFLAKFARKSGF